MTKRVNGEKGKQQKKEKKEKWKDIKLTIKLEQQWAQEEQAELQRRQQLPRGRIRPDPKLQGINESHHTFVKPNSSQ
jgi:hypothetical protein